MAFDEKPGRLVKQACISHGVSVITLGAYRSFALQVEKTSKRVRGHDLQLVVGALVRRYVALGPERAVLEDIAWSIFNVPPPTGP
jgi:hypothetical protein